MARYPRGQTPDEEWKRFGERMNRIIDLDKVDTEENYYKQLDKGFATAQSPLDRKHYPKLYKNNDKVQKIIEEKQATLDLYEKAQRFERRRKRKNRLADEARTSKRLIQRKNLTRGKYSRWRKRPNRSDVSGIDSRLARQGMINPSNLITKADLSLNRNKYLVFLDKLGRKHYYDRRRARFARNPFLRRR